MKTLLAVTVGFAIASLALSTLIRIRNARDPSGRITDQGEWPTALVDLVSKVDDADNSRIDVYCIKKWVDAEYYFRIDGNKEVVEMLKSKGLSPIDSQQGSVVRGFWMQFPPIWKKPAETTKFRYLASPGFHTTTLEGDSFFLALDVEHDLCFVWHCFTF